MRMQNIGLAVILIIMSGCTFLSNVSTYRVISKDVINLIAGEEYQKAYDYFVYKDYGREIPVDTFAQQIKPIRESIVTNFSTDYELSVVRASKTSYIGDAGPYPTEVIVQIEDSIKYGYIRIEYDDRFNKIINISLHPDIKPIPNFALFVLFGFIPLLVLGFNIYTLIRTLKSAISKKWLRIILIFLLNVPAFTYSLIQGFSFTLINFQILGLSLGMTGYAWTYWTFGIPIGSMIVSYQLSKAKLDKEGSDVSEQNE